MKYKVTNKHTVNLYSAMRRRYTKAKLLTSVKLKKCVVQDARACDCNSDFGRRKCICTCPWPNAYFQFFDANLGLSVNENLVASLLCMMF